MSFEVLVVFALLVVALVLFVWERFSFDVTAFIILGVLLATGILTPEEGIAGFSNQAVVTIGAMFVLSEGLRRTGLLDLVSAWITKLGGGSFWRTLLLLMLTIGGISAFINNTAAVALFIPVLLGVAASSGMSPSKLLIPVSFASMMGGVCTLIGTSTNLLVSSIAEEAGLGAFSMFQLAPVGLAFFAVGFGYVALAGVRLLPERRSGEDLTRGYALRAFITDVEVAEDSSLVGQTVASSALVEDLDLDVLEILRDGHVRVLADDEAGEEDTAEKDAAEEDAAAQGERRPQGTDVQIEAGDVLRIRGGAEPIDRLLDRPDLTVKPSEDWVDADLEYGRARLVEAVVAPDSAIVTRPVREANLARRFGAVVLALRRHGEIEREDLGAIELSGGDSLLLRVAPDRIDDIESDPSFTVVSEAGRPKRRDRMALAVTILAAVVATAAIGLVPIVVSAVVGALLLVLTRCLSTTEAYEAINWKVIFLLAGVLPLGTAMEKTGAAQILADQVIGLLGGFGPHAVLAGFFAVTVLLTAVVTNNATAVLMAPVAISAAETLGVDALPLVMGVTYAASLSFMTPMGYQTNVLVYGPGGYTFTDYTRVGTPLDLLLLALGTWLIPLVFPF